MCAPGRKKIAHRVRTERGRSAAKAPSQAVEREVSVVGALERRG